MTQEVVGVNKKPAAPSGSRAVIRHACGSIVSAALSTPDLTARRDAQLAKAHLAAIVESSGDAIIGKTLEGIVTSWNRGAERVYGYTAAEMVGKSISCLLPPDRGQELATILSRLRANESVEQYETVRIRKDGTRIDVSLTISPIRDAEGRLIAASTIARDITPLKQTLREKQANEQRIRLLLESTAEAIYGVDNDGRCTFVNPACVKLLGFDSADEMLGQNMHTLVHHSHPDGSPYPTDQCNIYRAFLQGARIHCEEEVLWRKDDQRIIVELWSHPMVETDGRIVGAVVTFTDITDRKMAMDKLREEIDRREQFLAMLSHELRNPLSAVRTAARVLNASDIDQATDEQSRRVIDRQTRHMSRLLDDLLDVARITQNKINLQKSVIDLRSTVEDSVQSVQSIASERRIEIDVSLPDQPLIVDGDPVRLQQIQANLLTNAIKYSPPGRRVRLEMQRDWAAAVIRVTDDGVGIAKEMLQRIFEMFVQSDRVHEDSLGGMGVGLTLVRSLVDLHGGTVIAHSEGRGRGSQFEVRLPLVIADEQTDTARPSDIIDQRSIRRIVIIEDQDDNRNMLTTLLELDGFEVLGAGTGREGLALVQRERPDAAIIDLGLPDIDGREVARRIREATDGDRQLLLIALTGHGQSEDIKQAFAAGFDHHLVKPFQPRRLAALLGRPAKTPK